MTDQELERPFLPPRWVARAAWAVHRGLFRLTGGRFGLRRPRDDRYGLMRLTATGRRSGEDRSVMLAYVEDGPDIVTVAMNGWHDADPAWWLNLQADPTARIELPDGIRSVRARVADGGGHDRLWRRWTDLDPSFERHARWRSTPTEVILLERVDSPG